MNIFISGGCKNGKSYYAQKTAVEMAAADAVDKLYYVATMMPHDEEDEARIKRHIEERKGSGFITLEQPFDICACLDQQGIETEGVFLLDSVTALLNNEMFMKGIDNGAAGRVAEELLTFAERTGKTLFVSDYIYSDGIIYDKDLTDDYRRGLAFIDRKLAAKCDKVVEIAYGRETVFK